MSDEWDIPGAEPEDADEWAIPGAEEALELVEGPTADDPPIVKGFKESALEKRRRLQGAPLPIRALQSTPIGDIYNYTHGVMEDPGGFKRDAQAILQTALPDVSGIFLGAEKTPGGMIGRAIKEDKLGELWGMFTRDAGRTAGAGGMDPKRPILSPVDALSGGSLATQIPRAAAAGGRAVSRAASKAGRGFKAKALSNELGALADDVKATRSLELATKRPAKHAGELKRLHIQLLKSEKDIRRLKPHIQKKYRAAWDAKKRGDPNAQAMYDDAFKSLMGDERTPAIEAQRAAMKIKERDAARAHLSDAEAIESAMRNRQLAERTHGDAVRVLDELGQNKVAGALNEAQKWAGRTGSIGAIATGVATGNPLAALGTAVAGYGAKAALQSPRVMGGAAGLLYRIAGKSNTAARKLAAMGITASSPPEKVLRIHALLSTVDEDYARETEGL